MNGECIRELVEDAPERGAARALLAQLVEQLLDLAMLLRQQRDRVRFSRRPVLPRTRRVLPFARRDGVARDELVEPARLSAPRPVLIDERETVLVERGEELVPRDAFEALLA